MTRESERPLVPLLGLFLLSGAVGLLYEVLWMRRLTLVFGATQLAISTVLAGFMLGLAGGAAIGGRLADRRDDPLRLYGLLELGIGLYALAFPWLLQVATAVYAAAFDAQTVNYWGSQGARLLLTGGLLLPPTAAMGATLPLLLRFVSGQLSRVGVRAGLLYGSNTLGAVIGTWATGFVLLPALGVRGTEVLAAWANVGVGVVALVAHRAWRAQGHDASVVDDRAERAEEDALLDLTPDPDLQGKRGEVAARLVVVALALSGASTMIFEVAWSRFLALILGSSVYAFTLMLVAFLVGTAGGSLAASAWLGKPGRRPLRGLVFVLAGAALAAFGTNHLFRFLPYWYVDLYALFGGADSLVFVSSGLLAGLVMTPATLCLGATFPLGARVVARRAEGVGRDVGGLYVANTLGAVVGALSAGFLLIPLRGIQETLLWASMLDLALAAVVLSRWVGPRLPMAAGLAAAAAFVALARPPWDPLLMSAGTYKYVSELSEYSHEAVRNHAISDFELLFYAEGHTSVVTVARSLGSGNIWLANNGKVDASSQSDMRTQVMLARLPFLVRPDSESALVVGLASGVTAGSALLEPGLKRVDVLEIEPAVIPASRYFDEHNNRPLDDPRVQVIANDARNHLVLSRGESYDVVINEPSNPWISGVSNLFTREYLELGRSRLSTDGIWVQWIQTYGMGAEDLKSLLRTVCDVFDHVVLFASLEDSDLLLLGSRSPFLRSGPADLLLPAGDPRQLDLERVGVADPYDLLSYVVLDRDGLMELAGDAPPNTDDNVRIEFNAPLHLHYDTTESNGRMLYEAMTGPWAVYDERVEDPVTRRGFLLGLAGAYEKREDWMHAAHHYELALAESPGDPEILARVETLRAKVAADLEQLADDRKTRPSRR